MPIYRAFLVSLAVSNPHCQACHCLIRRAQQNAPLLWRIHQPLRTIYHVLLRFLLAFGRRRSIPIWHVDDVDGAQKRRRRSAQKILEMTTSNRFVAVFMGVLVTILIQRSAATDMMVIGFVNSGLMTLMQAIGVIMAQTSARRLRLKSPLSTRQSAPRRSPPTSTARNHENGTHRQRKPQFIRRMLLQSNRR